MYKNFKKNLINFLVLNVCTLLLVNNILAIPSESPVQIQLNTLSPKINIDNPVFMKQVKKNNPNLKNRINFTNKDIVLAIKLTRLLCQGQNCAIHSVALKFALWLQGVNSEIYGIIKEKLVGMEYYDHYFILSENMIYDAAPELNMFYKKVLSELQQTGKNSGGAILEKNSLLSQQIFNKIETSDFDIAIFNVGNDEVYKFIKQFDEYFKALPPQIALELSNEYDASAKDLEEQWNKFYAKLISSQQEIKFDIRDLKEFFVPLEIRMDSVIEEFI